MSKRCSTISLPAVVVADANVVLAALIGGRSRLVIASEHGPRCIAPDAVAPANDYEDRRVEAETRIAARDPDDWL